MDLYFQAALAPSSQKTYTSAQNRYIRLCTSLQLSPLPLSEHQLCQFASFLAKKNLSHSSIKGYLSALRHLQIASGLPDPGIASMPKLEGVVKGIKSIQAKTKQKANVRLPITVDILRRIGEVWEQQGTSIDHCMLWAAVTMAFFGFLRAGELTVPSDAAFDPAVHLTRDDLSIDSISDPQSIKFRLKAFRKGVDIVVGRTGNKLCPVAAMLSYLAVGGNKTGFLFHFRDDKLLTKARFVESVRLALAAGFNQKLYSGHSFRSGAATTAGACGIPDSAIKMLGRWSSATYLIYIRNPRELLANYSALLGQSAL